MNYIKHLNAVFQQFAKDSRLNPTHISLYIALFQFWNINRFPETFYINREEVMKMAKIGSKATYHRCLKNLSDWSYIFYMPSHNPYKGSQIKMLKFGTSSETSIDTTYGTSSEQVLGQALVPNINSNKQIENNNKRKLPKNENEVLDFFKKRKWPSIEGKKFFNHYTSIGWKLGGKIKIFDWQASAENWILKAAEIKKEQTVKEVFQNRDNLKTNKNKDYGQPL
ncbi:MULTISPECIES: hypothetical protein [Flavobacteriaceae]|jgi:hypothetical protein|uniref:hypothetical protein n=1 Tax=Flavobacteriaceae TaxID=49546 RepID=UPI000C8E9196|nr:hypothetical protein [Altibacter sp.]MAP56081.1 hypothetical protein [Altibacter sp.]|tara:strand:- start:9993 stop:10664 length:672 start_codon:yes stop_codon:yes gene_type:complete